jgi:CheY-like chemotaxis protein
MSANDNRRILVVDDNAAIHEDFKKILCGSAGVSDEAASAKAAFFGGAQKGEIAAFEIDSAYQGSEALEKVKASLTASTGYATAFVDVRMPPGLDGVETIERLWKIDPDVQCVICTAFADYTWQSMIEKLGSTDRLLILKKPFDPIEVRQLATALTEKWNATRRERARLSEVKRAEQEARVYAASLVTVNRALETAKASAEALARFRSEFLVGVTQELRAPATTMLGSAEALENPEIEDDSRRSEIKSLRESGGRLLTTMNDVHDWALIELGLMKVASKACSPSRIIDEVLAELRADVDAKGLTIARRSLRPIPELIDSDPACLRRVLRSLIGALVCMSPKKNGENGENGGSIAISMDMERVEEWQEPQLEIAIVHSGLVLSSNQTSRMFEALAEDVSAGTTRSVASRLGLALAKRLTRLLGGDVDVESSSAVGTRFTLSVKTGDISDVGMIHEPRGALPDPARSEAPARTPLHGRVLIVEDNPTTQHLLRHVLVSAGAEVSLAENGEVGRDLAIDAVRVERPFALVLMDMQMPKLDGYAATSELRALGYRGPIVAVTAHCMQGDREKCMNAGCDDFIAKPIDRESFLATCAKWMKSSEPDAPLPASSAVESKDARDSKLESTRFRPR